MDFARILEWGSLYHSQNHPGTESAFLVSPTVASGFFTIGTNWK